MSTRAHHDDSLEKYGKTIQAIKRHRKQRHTKFRELLKDDDEFVHTPTLPASSVTCPVCMKTVVGDEDVLEAHVNACLAYEGQRLEQERVEREQAVHDVWDAGGSGTHIGNVSGMQGAGFHLRNQGVQDVDDDIDIDGDDEAVFGGAQFTEEDILTSSLNESAAVDVDEEMEDVEVHVDDDGEEGENDGAALRSLVAQGKVIRRATVEAETLDSNTRAEVEQVIGVGDADKLDLALTTARRSGDPAEVVKALEQKVKHLESMRVSSSTSLLCRICLDPYTEPTVSTGCWHTCCRECWLRCLGSTKLCPICKRITIATDLRRVYL
ncbi:hypothetical protein HGRIS_009303 [Hohenbuehelia grisea]